MRVRIDSGERESLLNALVLKLFGWGYAEFLQENPLHEVWKEHMRWSQ